MWEGETPLKLLFNPFSATNSFQKSQNQLVLVRGVVQASHVSKAVIGNKHLLELDEELAVVVSSGRQLTKFPIILICLIDYTLC